LEIVAESSTVVWEWGANLTEEVGAGMGEVFGIEVVVEAEVEKEEVIVVAAAGVAVDAVVGDEEVTVMGAVGAGGIAVEAAVRVLRAVLAVEVDLGSEHLFSFKIGI
jgi:hypothetical protein